VGESGLLHDVIVGRLFNGEIHFIESFGLLSSGLYVPFGMVLPYIISFYLILGILEDVGYLPRLAVLLDTTMHKIGLHGFAIIPTLLGFGCNVPAVMATRVLESKRERFIAATLVCIAIPCASAQAMIFGLVGKYGGQYVAFVYITLFLVWIILGVFLNRLLKGFSPELLIEIPPYRVPPWGTIIQKLWGRTRGFLIEAVPMILAAVLVITYFCLWNIRRYSRFYSTCNKGRTGPARRISDGNYYRIASQGCRSRNAGVIPNDGQTDGCRQRCPDHVFSLHCHCYCPVQRVGIERLHEIDHHNAHVGSGIGGILNIIL